MVSVTYDSIKVKVDFSSIEALVTATRMTGASVSRRNITSIQHKFYAGMEYIEIGMIGVTKKWTFSLDGSGNSLPVSDVNGVIPLDINHLHTLLDNVLV